MKRACLLLVLLSSFAFAQNWTAVTGSNVTTGSNTKVATGEICFRATDANDRELSGFRVGGGGQVVQKPVCCVITNGAIAASCQVPNPALTAPANILYRIEVTSSEGRITYRKASLSGPTFNFDNYVPSTTPVQSGQAVDRLTVAYLTITSSCDGCATLSAADATATTKGVLRLTGDLGGTADTPIVPALANKVNTSDVSVTAAPSKIPMAKLDGTLDASWGAVGLQGPAGTAATVAVGTVSTGSAGSSAQVTNSGTSSAAVLNFTIPRGDVGQQGPAGPVVPPTATALGGVKGDGTSLKCSGTNKLDGFNTDGSISCAADQTATGGTAPHALIDTATHTASGLTAGHVVRATGATTYAFQAIQDADLPAAIARDSELAAYLPTSDAATTPSNGKIPRADATSKIADGWLTDTVTKLGQTIEAAELGFDPATQPELDAVAAAKQDALTFPLSDAQVANGITLDNLTQITTRSFASLQSRPFPCEIPTSGTGTGGVLQDSDDYPVGCYNDTGATVTISAIRCYADTGAPTVMVTITGGANALSSNLVCGTGAWTSGTLNGTPTLPSNGTLDVNVVSAGGTAKWIRVMISGVY